MENNIFENVRNQNEQKENQNETELESKEEILDKNLLEIQLKYIQKILSGELQPLEQQEKDTKNNQAEVEKVEEVLSNYSTVNEFFDKVYEKYINISDTKIYQTTKNEVFKTVQELMNIKSEDWPKQVINTLVNETKEASKRLKESKVGTAIEKLSLLKEAGSIKFWPVDSKEYIDNFNLDPGKKYIRIHIPALGVAGSEASPVESLKKLGRLLKEEYPNVEAILADSWLVGSPIGKRLGFKAVKEDKTIGNSLRFWGQFINQNGEVDEGRVNRFLESGEPKFYPTYGYITKEDFLEKYI